MIDMKTRSPYQSDYEALWEKRHEDGAFYEVLLLLYTAESAIRQVREDVFPQDFPRHMQFMRGLLSDAGFPKLRPLTVDADLPQSDDDDRDSGRRQAEDRERVRLVGERRIRDQREVPVWYRPEMTLTAGDTLISVRPASKVHVWLQAKPLCSSDEWRAEFVTEEFPAEAEICRSCAYYVGKWGLLLKEGNNG